MEQTESRLVLNGIGPFLGLPCLGEVVAKRFRFLWGWILVSIAIIVGTNYRNLIDPSILALAFWWTVFWSSLVLYPLVSVFPFVRDAYLKRRARRGTRRSTKPVFET